MKKFFKYLLSLLVLFSIVGCNNTSSNSSSNSSNSNSSNNSNNNVEYYSDTFDGVTYTVYEDQPYNTKYEVAIYIHFFEKLPKNYVTKAKSDIIASEWTPENKLSVGGNKFHNREGLLPEDGNYIECDIESRRTSRGAKRIVFDKIPGNYKVYYTPDHYRTFEEIY